MTKKDAIKQYVKGRVYIKEAGGISAEKMYRILREYQDADEYCVVMENDRSLMPVYVPLPQPPEWHLIDGFGLERQDQVFTRVAIPKRLKDLERTAGTIDAVWDELENNQRLYREEIEFIKKQIWHELNGYWCFINGKPTFIPGDFYVTLNFWNFDKGLPEYRERDRKIWLFDWWLQQDNRFAGFNYPKHRREGATSKAGAKQYLTIVKLINADGGVQSKTEEHAENVFTKHIVRPWKKLPFWLKPEYDGTDNPKKTGLNFVPPARVAKMDNKGKKSGLLIKDVGLGSTITYKSSDAFAYDSYKLYFHHGDEVGKTKDVDTNERYFKIRECLTEGPEIHGWCWNTSTVEEMDSQGGANFKNTCDGSHYHDIFINDSGRTKTWLANLFIPASEGRNGFVGKYGESIIDDPSIEQLAYLKERYPHRAKYIGAKQDILNERKSFEDKGDMMGLMGYKRMYPLEWSDCWISANLDTGMPHDVLQARMSELSLLLAKKGQQEVKRGNFHRYNPADRFSKVYWMDDPNGKFEVSFLFHKEADANKGYMRDGQMVPSNTGWGIAGADPFAANKLKNKRFSNGGGAVFMYRTAADTDDLMDTWDGYRFVCVYNHRPRTKEEYHNDMMMMCRYYGVYINPENNRMDLVDDMQRAGFGAYLKYMKDQRTGKMNANPGFFTSESLKTRMWNLLRDYYTQHGHREMHMGILEELSNIEGVEMMVKYDLFVACAGALLGVDDQTFEEVMEGDTLATDLTDWFN